MGRKTSRLIIQGQQGQRGRKYHMDIEFPYGQINLSPRFAAVTQSNDLRHTRFGDLWCDPSPELKTVPGRLAHVLRSVMTQRWRGDELLLDSLAVRTCNFSAVLSSKVPKSKIDEALVQLDAVVISALRADLSPDGEDGDRWFDNPGPRVQVERIGEPSTNIVGSGPDGDTRIPLNPEIGWVNFSGYRLNTIGPDIPIGWLRQLPTAQIELLHALYQTQGVCNCNIFQGLGDKGWELVLTKGRAWTWPAVMNEFNKYRGYPDQEAVFDNPDSDQQDKAA